MPAFIDELIAGNMFLERKDIVNAGIEVSSIGDEGMIHLTIKKD
jgi:hypothetical protein